MAENKNSEETVRVIADIRFNGHEKGLGFSTTPANAKKWEGMGLCHLAKKKASPQDTEFDEGKWMARLISNNKDTLLADAATLGLEVAEADTKAVIADKIAGELRAQKKPPFDKAVKAPPADK